MEQGRPDEALAALQQSMALWYTPHPDSTQAQAAAQQATTGGKKAKKGGRGAAKQQQQQQPRVPLPPEEMPSYEFRLESVKLLLELEDTIETAAEVLLCACCSLLAAVCTSCCLRWLLPPSTEVAHWRTSRRPVNALMSWHNTDTPARSGEVVCHVHRCCRI